MERYITIKNTVLNIFTENKSLTIINKLMIYKKNKENKTELNYIMK